MILKFNQQMFKALRSTSTSTLFLFVFLAQQFSFAQSFTDPSFENLPGTSWSNCTGTADQQPGNWGVTLPPSDGANYFGMVCRINGTKEAVGQQISAPLLHNQAYEFTIDLAYAPIYNTARLPTVLRVWGATMTCGKHALLWTSPEINHTNWQQYTVSFTTSTVSYNSILLEVFFYGNIFYEGSLLLDNLSSITPIVSLPITLIDFSAKWDEGYATVKLDWSTSSEINNDYFTIERSTDGRNFTPILTEVGAGNSNEILSYSVVDENPYMKGTAYYRLKQTDFDGTYAYSKTIALVPKQGGNKVNLSIFPNPATNQLTVNIPFDKETTTDVSLSIINQQGALVQKIQYAEYNTTNQTILLDNLAAGIYMLRYIDGAGNQGAKTFLVHQK